MDNETEKNIIQRLLDLKGETKTLKAKITKLSNRVAIIENLDFQQQIVNLGDKVTKLSESLLETKRALAKFEMDFAQYHLIGLILDKLSGSKKETLTQQVKMQFARSTEALKHSSEPLSIAAEFRSKCMIYSDEYNLGAYG